MEKSKINILLINSDGENKLIESNKGAEAVLITTVNLLRHQFPNANITSMIQLSQRLKDHLNCGVINNKIDLVKTYGILGSIKSTAALFFSVLWHIFSSIGYDVEPFLITRKMKQIRKSNVIVHVGMDLYSDDFGLLTIIEHTKDLISVKLLKKPTVIWAESLGPFNSKITRMLATYTLNHSDLIIVRDEISRDTLISLGLPADRIHLAADPAFLLKPVRPSSINIDDHQRYVSVSLSLTYMAKGVERKPLRVKLLNSVAHALVFALPEKYFLKLLARGRRLEGYDEPRNEYIAILAKVFNEMAIKENIHFILIPHIQHPIVGEESIHRELANRIGEDRATLFEGLTAQEIKWVIGSCYGHIGGRMHSNIAALSQGIPTIGISYSYKFKGIMGLLGQENMVIERFDKEEMLLKMSCLLENHDSIHLEIMERLPKVNDMALDNATILKKFMEEAI